MHSVMGRPMLEWTVQTAMAVTDAPPVVVVGHGREAVEGFLSSRVRYAVQPELLGTGHAVAQAQSLLQGNADVVVVTYGDMPLLQPETLSSLVELFVAERQAERSPALAMLTVVRDDPQGFGRIVRAAGGDVQAIVEEVDCTPEQLAISELNPGIYCFEADWLWQNLPNIPLSAKGEYYLTDLVGIAVQQGRKVVTQAAPVADVDGINTRVHLAQATEVLRRRILERHMLAGVTIIDPNTTYIEEGVEIGQDSTIWPGTMLQGATVIGERASIGPHAQVVDTQVGDECRVVYSVLEQARMERRSQIGPFGHLRAGAHLAEDVHMGNFGEVKNSYLGPGVKMGHFSYLGDATIGANVNIGAGTITCNFDGKSKQRTEIGNDVFIGSDTMLVAPVVLGEGARTGAGSVVTHDVPPNTLVYGVPARSKPKQLKPKQHEGDAAQ
jgi:bifunctional UDP-N-acetylglucosamine pyrophosphorylase / glucosamine-1-phosphate N-acetyltransferase